MNQAGVVGEVVFGRFRGDDWMLCKTRGYAYDTMLKGQRAKVEMFGNDDSPQVTG